MAIRVAVIDMTGSGRPPVRITLEAGRCSSKDLRQTSLRALGFADSGAFRIEPRTSAGIATRRIESGCSIFIFREELSFLDSLLGDLNDLDCIFRDIFNQRRKT